MEKFCRFKKNDYNPVSYDSNYLFSKYDDIVSYVSELNKDLKFILAKTIVSDFHIDWHSKYSNLTEVKSGSNDIIIYQNKIKPVLSKANELIKNKNQEDQDWGKLLLTVFDINNNLVFSNGSDISIVWGWKFEKYRIVEDEIIVEDENVSKIEEIVQPPIFEEPIEEIINEDEKLSEEEPIMPFEDKTFPIYEEIESSNYFQKFATKFYWLIPLLIITALTIFFIKSLIY
jgi:signal peptidase I